MMTEPAPPAMGVEPLTPQIGVVVHNLDLRNGALADNAAQLRALLDEYLVLAVPGQFLNAHELRDLTRHFGPLFDHHDAEFVLRHDEVPEVLHMLKEADGTRLFGGGGWHADVSFRQPAAYASLLQAVELPRLGGDTLFASAPAAFAALSNTMQDMLRPLRVIHSYDGPGAPVHPEEHACHPLVRTHPTRGVESLYINRMFAHHIDGMTPDESRPLIDMLDAHMSRPEFCCRISWQPGQLVLWDNRFTLHYPSNDFSGERRHLIRCTALEPAQH